MDSGQFMDAYTFNRCENQILSVIQEVSTLIKADIEINVGPLEGGKSLGQA